MSKKKIEKLESKLDTEYVGYCGEWGHYETEKFPECSMYNLRIIVGKIDEIIDFLNEE